MSTDQHVTWLACANGDRVATCQHTPRCAPLRPGQRPGQGPFGRYIPADQFGGVPAAVKREVTTVAAALAAYDSRPSTGPGTGLSAVIPPNRLAALEGLLLAARAEQGSQAASATIAPDVADALAGVDHAQGEPGKFGLGPAHELAALRDLADAVRAAEVAPQLGTRYTDAHGTTWTVRAVMSAIEPRGWHVAAQEGELPRWSTWHVWRHAAPADPLIWALPRVFATDMLTADEVRQTALEDMAERAGVIGPPPLD